MKPTQPLIAILSAFLSSLLLPHAGWGATTAFTYQGRLGQDGEPANGTYEMVFQLRLSGTPTPAGAPITEIVVVREGIFNVTLDFGAGVFDGTDYDLQLAVKEEGAAGSPIPLDPPHRITPTPQAIHAMTTSQVPDTALSPNVPIIVNNVLRLPGLDAKLLFGPAGESSLGIDPRFPGLVERDPTGFRLLGRNDEGGRLLFGPTDECTIGVEPDGPRGVLIRDPDGVRVINSSPRPVEGHVLQFGAGNECRISAGSERFGGIMLWDPQGFLFTNPLAAGEAEVNVDSAVLAAEFVQMSSRRFKDNIRQIEQPLEKVQKLRGVRFDWRSEKGGKPAIGFIAEEVGKVIPEVVAWEKDGKTAKGVNYGHLVALAVEGIKAQQSEIESLNKQNSVLEQRLAKLEELILKTTQQTGE